MMMYQDLSIPDPTIVLDHLEAFRRSKTMFAAVDLGVFDELGEKTISSEVLAAQLHCHEPSLRLLLESCVGLGLLKRTTEGFQNTDVSRAYLCSDSPRRMTGYIQYSNHVMWKMWAHLEDAIREGTHRWKQTFGFDGPIFSHFFRTPEAMEEFLMGMHGFGMITSPRIVELFDLSRYRVLCDLGGATGHLAIAACHRYPTLAAKVFDLPHALDLARRMTREAGLSDRIEIVGGDFFVDPLPEADLYALGRIVHDWDEPKIRILLQKIYDALPSGGALLIGEKVLWENRSGPRWAQMQSLNMLVCTEGKERSGAEYAQLLRGVGFSQVAVSRTQVPLDAVLAIKS
jgi:acetylserotonin N-methyltransferase